MADLAPLLDDLLVKTSRTFALSIPRLEEPTRREVTVAYLLFRIADTFEDAADWPLDRRTRALEDFATLLDGPGPVDRDAARRLTEAWTSGEPPVDHEGYLELLAATPEVLDACEALASEARDSVAEHTVRTARGMADFVERHGGEEPRLVLQDLGDLQGYCYVVAGIVGEMLTELFLLGAPSLTSRADALRARAATFGEALQLVNIVKDAADDAEEGRTYLPPGVDRAVVFDLARRDLDVAVEYVELLEAGGAPRGTVAFTALPVLLARATLDRVEERGPGSKLTRPEVAAAVEGLETRLASGEPALRPVRL